MIVIPGIVGGGGGGGKGTLKVSLSKGIPPKPSKPDHVTETKIVYFVILFKTKTLFYNPDSFRFACRIE